MRERENVRVREEKKVNEKEGEGEVGEEKEKHKESRVTHDPKTNTIWGVDVHCTITGRHCNMGLV